MASVPVELRPRARRDLGEIAVYLAEKGGSQRLAYRFLDAAERAFQQLAAMPEVGVVREFRHPELRGVRLWRIEEFKNYLIFYRPGPRSIEVMRVLHAKRDIAARLGEGT